MFVVYIGTIVTALLYAQALAGHGEARPGSILAICVWLLFTVLFANFAEALAEGRSRAQATALRGMRQTVMAKKVVKPGEQQHDAGEGGGSAQRRRGPGGMPRHHSGGRRGDRRRRLGRRERHHGRIGARHPRIGWGLLLGDGRNARAVRLDPGARDGESGRDLSRSDDLDGGGRQAAEDPERDRADHPAGRPHAGIPDRHRDALAVLAVCRRGEQGGHARDAHRAHRAARVPHPDDHRRPVVGDRRRGHEPHDAGERHRDVGPRRRGGRRRRRAAARQDRHHHARQPASLAIPAGARRDRATARRCRAARIARGRNARGPQHRRAREAALQSARARLGLRSARASCRSPPSRE